MRLISALLLIMGAWLLEPGQRVWAEAVKDSAASPLSGAHEAAGEPAKVEGFRSASFGMTEAQVRQAIRKDFPGPGEKIASEINPAEKTTVLSVIAADLIPGTGKAHLAYILGFTTKKLIQVNINWTSEPKTAAAEELVGAANLLRNYFVTAGYRSDSIVVNHQMPSGYIVFRGLDEHAHMVLLALTGSTVSGEGEKAKPPAKPQPITLQLSYILNPEHPDVYQVPKGSF